MVHSMRGYLWKRRWLLLMRTLKAFKVVVSLKCGGKVDISTVERLSRAAGLKGVGKENWKEGEWKV